jgi:Pyridoxamine 5'-phosphate oxidase
LRDPAQRKADTLAKLEKQADVWLATADPGGRPHLVAVSAWWDGTDLVIATRAGTKTARNLAMNPTAKIARGGPSDAVLIDAHMVESGEVEASPELCEGFAAAVGWDPREEGKGWNFFRLRPSRIQAFRGYEEVTGRDVMLGSRWVV